MKRLLAFSLAAFFLMATFNTAFGQPADYKHDLVHCRFNNGIAMPEDECIALRKYYADVEAKRAAQDAYLAKANAEYETKRAVEREKRDQDQAKWAAERAEKQAKDAERDAEYKRQSAADDKAYALAEKKAAAAEDLRKSKCGGDYKKPSIGMTMDRVRECVSTSFKLAGQTNTDQGVVTTYRAPGGYLHVIDGKVVQWGKF